MDTKTIIFLILGGGILLYVVYKLQPATVTVPTLVPVGKVGGEVDQDEQIFRSSQLAAFTGLLGLGRDQLSFDLGSKGLDTSLDLEEIRAASQARSEDVAASTTLKLAETSSSLQTQLANIQAETMKTLQFQGLEFASSDKRTQLAAIQDASQQFRKQSLERQGSIFNAINEIFGGGAPYNYQDAFGGPRPPTFLQQLGPFLQQLSGAVTGAYKGFV